MSKMIFYYDETFHDRKITALSDGNLNIYNCNDNDSFIFSILGVENENNNNVLQEYERIEKKTKKELGLDGELKSTTFKRSFFENGFSSMNKTCKSFYNSFLTLIMDNNLKYQVGCISKTEYLIFQFVYALDFPQNYKKNLFIYGLTKFIEQHRLCFYLQDLVKGEKSFLEKFKTSLIELLNKFLIESKGIAREKEERAAVKSLIYVLINSKIKENKSICRNWDYNIVAEAIKLRISELSNKNAVVILDKEPLTHQAFLKNGLNASEYDSKDCLGVRMTDMFVGFVGRFIFFLKNNTREPDYKSLYEIKRDNFMAKRLLCNKWFDLTKDDFLLIKQLGAFFGKATYWSGFSLNYMDDIIHFFSFFNYIALYQNYEQFCKNRNNHNELYNKYVCDRLSEYFDEMINDSRF